MMLAVQDALVGLGVEDTKIHMELFTSPVGKLGQSEQTSHEVTQSEMALSSAAPLVTKDPKAPTGQSSPMMNGGTIKHVFFYNQRGSAERTFDAMNNDLDGLSSHQWKIRGLRILGTNFFCHIPSPFYS